MKTRQGGGGSESLDVAHFAQGHGRGYVRKVRVTEAVSFSLASSSRSPKNKEI
jgi:hypothetical protein